MMEQDEVSLGGWGKFDVCKVALSNLVEIKLTLDPSLFCGHAQKL